MMGRIETSTAAVHTELFLLQYYRFELIKMNIQEQIEELKSKALSQESLDSIETHFREFITELYVKRDQVTQLRSDLNLLDLENKLFKGQLDAAKRTNKELDFNLKVFKKKASIYDKELAEAKGTVLQMKMQRQLSAAEINSLKESLQKSELERIELSKKVDLYETKQKYYNTYSSDFLKREKDLRNCFDEMNSSMESVKSEQLQLMESVKCLDLAKSTKHLEESKNSIRMLTVEKTQLEQNHIKTLAKLEKLEELETNYGTPNKYNSTDIVLNQWKANRTHYCQQSQQEKEAKEKMIVVLGNERMANSKLISSHKDDIQLNEELRSELEQIKITSRETTKTFSEKRAGLHKENEVITIKEESIVIVD